MSEVQVSHVLQYLSGVAQLRCPSSESFVLEHGRLFRKFAQKQPKLGSLKQCYYNAARMAMRSKGKLIYVEGYAMAMIPMHHAWCIDLDGHVLETTWRPSLRWPNLLADYYGIPFCTTYLIRSLAKWQQYGLLDNWKGKWPVQNSPRSEWIHPTYSHLTYEKDQ